MTANVLDLSPLEPSVRDHLLATFKGAAVLCVGGPDGLELPPTVAAELVDYERTALAAANTAPGRYVIDLPPPAPDQERFERNPFAPGSSFNLTEQAQIWKRDPALADRMKVAARGEVNPWLPGMRNLTEQTRITRDDPALAAKLKAAADGK